MPDIRALETGASYNGKLIYQLTSASALKDTDLFAISSTDNLTRKVSLSQIKASFSNDYYNKEDMDILIDGLKQQIKNVSDQIFDINNDITEFRNEFNNKLSEQYNTLNKSISNLDQRVKNLDTSLSKKITDLDTKFTNIINELITYGTDIPTTLETGKVYLQYF